jgi:hypothetical protein
MQQYRWMILLMFTTFLVSCIRDPRRTSQAMDYFPNTVNDSWTYKLTDSMSSATSTVNVKITGTHSLPTGPVAKVWVYYLPGRMDTNYVYPAGDTIVVLDKQFAVTAKYIIPFQTGSKWQSSSLFQYDSITVKQQSAVTANGVNYTNAFQLNERGGCCNSYAAEEDWFSPYLGFVIKKRKELNLGLSVNQSWELISYQLH